MDGVPLLARWRGEFYAWRDGVWMPREPSTIRNFLYAAVSQAQYPDPDNDDEARFWSANVQKVNNLIEALGTGLLFRGEDSDTAEAENAVTVFRNGILDRATMAFEPLTPRVFNLTMLPYDYDPNASCPMWVAFMKQAFPDDDDSIRLMQQCMGYAVFGGTSRQKATAMIGKSRSGKGTSARVWRALIGEAATVQIKLNKLGRGFGMASLIGKRLATLGDVRWEVRGVRDGITTLLEITGEDAQTIERKYKEDWSGMLPLHVLLMSNDVPDFTDPSGAFENRLNLLHFRQSFADREDPGLTGRLLTELPGILNWSLVGWRDLEDLGHFLRPGTSEELREEMRELASSVRPFAAECVEFGDPAWWTSTEHLFKAWSIWRTTDNVAWSPDKSKFSREFNKLFADRGVAKEYRNFQSGPSRRGFRGVRLIEGFLSRYPGVLNSID